MPDAQITGGRVNYYLVRVEHPQREDQAPYQAECEDIIEALSLNPDEANIFKEIWRSAAARQHNGKPGHTALYGAEKIVHYAGRILRRVRRQSDAKSITEREVIASLGGSFRPSSQPTGATNTAPEDASSWLSGTEAVDLGDLRCT